MIYFGLKMSYQYKNINNLIIHNEFQKRNL
jgi:hypothetical protein